VKRVAIEDVSTPAQLLSLGAMRVNPTLRALSICLDQVARDGDDQAKRFGEPWAIDSPTHADNLAHAETLVTHLESAAQIGRKMVDAIRAQFPQPAKGAKRA
jgi:hypothetical protein